MDSDVRYAQMSVDYRFLEKALRLPPEVRIVGVDRQTGTYSGESCHFLVTAPFFPPPNSNGSLPIATPIFLRQPKVVITEWQYS